MAKTLTFGFLYDLRNPQQWRKPWADLYAETLDFIAWTESLGFDAAWIPEHHVADDGYVPSPLVTLGAVAARTKTMKLGSAVALAPFYHPVRFAEDCAVLDILSGGRLELGVALGYRRRETDAYGIDFSSRGSRMNEFLEVVGRLWAGEAFSHEGKHFTLRNAAITPRPLRDRIPLFIGGGSAKAMERVARYGDGYLGGIELHDLYVEKLRACGKAPEAARIYIPSTLLVVDHDPERALDEVAPYYHYVNNSYGQWLHEDSYDDRMQNAAIPKEMSLEDFKASGLLKVLTPGQAIDMFKAMRARAPVEHVTISVPPGIPLSKFAKYAETFAHEVIPAFR